jgi:hypothetical protein
MILGPSGSQSSNRCLIKELLCHGVRLYEGNPDARRSFRMIDWAAYPGGRLTGHPIDSG